MDDLLTGSNSAESCHHLQKCVHDTLAQAGFVPRKYQSNSAAVLEQIDSSLVEKASTREFCNADSVSVLGVYWNSKADVFSLKIQRTNLPQSQFTRRALLSEISRTFDPLGFAAPFTIRGKLFMQRVWKEPGGWDDPLPPELADDFQVYWEEMAELERFQLPRSYSNSSDLTPSHLVGFCDASESAYCAVLYLVPADQFGKRSVSFVCAKTRVAPIKTPVNSSPRVADSLVVGATC